MAWTPDPFPAALLVWCGLLLCLSFAVLSRTLARRSRLALLLSVSFGAVSLWGLVSSFWTPDSWSAQTLIERLIELPIVATFAILCAIQARRTPASKSRLKQTLRMGAPLIFGAWILALVGEQIWPQPILNPFARMPVRNFTLLATLCIPIMAYQWILVYAFIRAARSKVATMRLRLQNLFVAVGLAGYALSGINVVVGYGFQAFVANPLLREITLVQFAIEDRLLVVWASAFLIALVLAGGAAASKAARWIGGLASRLKARALFEAEWWQMEAAGGAGKLAAQLYAASVAADRLGLSGTDLVKATQAVKLAALLRDASDANSLSPDKACELLEMLNDGEPNLVSAAEAGNIESARLSEVVEAALALSGHCEDDPGSEIHFRDDWRCLALAAARDAGITPTPKVAVAMGGAHREERVFSAYAAAAESLAARGA